MSNRTNNSGAPRSKDSSVVRPLDDYRGIFDRLLLEEIIEMSRTPVSPVKTYNELETHPRHDPSSRPLLD